MGAVTLSCHNIQGGTKICYIIKVLYKISNLSSCYIVISCLYKIVCEMFNFYELCVIFMPNYVF